MVGRSLNLAHALQKLGAIINVHISYFQHTHNTIQGCAHIMANSREEGALGLIGALGFVQGSLQHFANGHFLGAIGQANYIFSRITLIIQGINGHIGLPQLV